MHKKLIVTGSGFAGLSAACFMAKAGWDVTVLEKNAMPGGRARQLVADGFTFDMGPSWYWMPDVFDRFFAQFGKTTADYYTLQRLDPSYRVYRSHHYTDIPADYTALETLFEETEPGSAARLQQFLKEAAYKYRKGMQQLVYKPGLSVTEFADPALLIDLFKLDILGSMKKHVARFFKTEALQQLMEFPVLFLGALPEKIPALYSLMNYADIKGGTWYPQGGMYQVVQAMYSLALELGVQFRFNEAVQQLQTTGNKVTGVVTAQNIYTADAVIGAADYHHMETALLPPHQRSYSDAYWNSRVMAPGCLLYYIGLNKKLNNVLHHSLFFDTSFEIHGKEIYTNPQWPSNPLFYVSTTSVTDAGVAPGGCENLFFLVPVAAGLQGDTTALRDRYFDKIAARFEQHTGQSIRGNIIYKRSFAYTDFVEAYHAFKGNAYGLANTLLQTAILKPRCRSKKISNLFYTGQLTVPGPGVPPSLISGEVVAKEVLKVYGR
ncbi:phytoene desaturase family protein [Deminuibacter soli]|uniref:Phytoene desaturase n=1 Tax=Deminuibacter soli TaxID=2291815 RepID=A0A3E1NFS2_9BACT|nr:phytoene desaturase family protein [Deminuibacter soli]RFM26638.1 phytoene desaturase [Deminuibacter soli]